MATKAELEAELEELKQMLAEARAAKAADAEAASETTPEPDAAASGETPLNWAFSHLDGAEVERMFDRFADEAKELHRSRPLLTTFGIFVLGYILGRSR